MAKDRLGKLALEIEVDRSKFRNSLQQAKADAKQAVGEMNRGSRLTMQGGADVAGGGVSRDAIAARAEAMRVSETRRRRDAEERRQAREMLTQQGFYRPRSAMTEGLSQFAGVAGMGAAGGYALAAQRISETIQMGGELGTQALRNRYQRAFSARGQAFLAGTGQALDAQSAAQAMQAQSVQNKINYLETLAKYSGDAKVLNSIFVPRLEAEKEQFQRASAATNAAAHTQRELRTRKARLSGRALNVVGATHANELHDINNQLAADPDNPALNAAKRDLLATQQAEYSNAIRDSKLSRSQFDSATFAAMAGTTAARAGLAYDSRGAYLARQRQAGYELAGSVAGSMEGKTGEELRRAKMLGLDRIEQFRAEAKLAARDYVLSTPYATGMSAAQASGAIQAQAFLGTQSTSLQDKVGSQLDEIIRLLDEQLRGPGAAPIPPASRN